MNKFVDRYPVYEALLAVIIGLGIFLRLKDFTAPAIWYDESLTFAAAKLPFLSMLEAIRYTYAPPLWGILVWGSVRLFGHTEFALRILALIPAILTIGLLYKVAAGLGFGKGQKLVLMASFCLLPYPIWTAQDGRIYAIFSLVYLLCVLFAIRNNWLGLTLGSLFLLYSHYIGPFYMIGLYAAAFFTSPGRKQVLKCAASAGAAMLLFLPWVPVYLETAGEQFTVPPFDFGEMAIAFHRLAFSNTLKSPWAVLATLTVSLVVFAACSVWLYQTLRKYLLGSSRPGSFSIVQVQWGLAAFLPFLVMLLWSFLWKDFIYYRLLVGLCLPSLIVVVDLLGRFLPGRFLRASLSAWWIFLVVLGTLQWTPYSRDGNMRQAITFIQQNWREGDVLYHISGTSYMPVSFYFPGRPMYLVDEDQHGWLLPIALQQIFGVPRADLARIPYKRAWIFYAQEILLTPAAREKAERYIAGGILQATVSSWQFATIRIYLVPNLASGIP
jgi:hypothetical protein